MAEHYIFMNGGLTEKFTGIEGAAFKRYKLFNQQLGIQPIYLSMYFDLDLPKHIEALKASGRIPENFRFINLYQYFLRDCDSKRKIIPDSQRTLSTSLLKNNDQKRVAKVYDLETGYLSFVNYYDEGGNRYRMDKYDEEGYLTISILFTPDGRTVRQLVNYYRQDGSLAISIHYGEVNGNNKIRHIVVYDKSGTPCESYTTEDELYAYLLRYYLNSFSHQDTVNLFIDRHVRFAKQLKDGRIAAKLNCLHMMHNIHLEDPVDKSSKLSSAYKYLEDLEHFDGVVTLTPQQTTDITERFGNYGNVHCIPHAIDQLPAPVAHDQRQPLRCIAVGRLHHQKNHARMIDIFARVVEQLPEAQLDIYGKGELEMELAEQITKLKLENNVHLKGFSDNIQKEFETAQCQLMTSNYEGQPLVILESLSFGCPVISRDIAYGPASMIEDGQNGFLLDREDDQGFAERIIQVLTDQELAKNLSEQAYQSTQNFSPENLAPRWKNLIDWLK